MKTWLIIVSVVVVLLAASTGVGFSMLTGAKAELNETRVELTDIKAELTGIQGKLTELQVADDSEGEYPWCAPLATPETKARQIASATCQRSD